MATIRLYAFKESNKPLLASVRDRAWQVWPRAILTEAGIRELRALLEDRRAMDPERFAHLRRELGLDAGEAATD
jgi:hypothetical protein